jgi:hypothetical protein
MAKQQPGYLSYLLRLWRVSDQQGSEASSERVAWRASLEDPRTGELHKFASLEEVFDFLRAHMGRAGGIATDDAGGREKPA